MMPHVVAMASDVSVASIAAHQHGTWRSLV
jgi:hypothetical protein